MYQARLLHLTLASCWPLNHGSGSARLWMLVPGGFSSPHLIRTQAELLIPCYTSSLCVAALRSGFGNYCKVVQVESFLLIVRFDDAVWSGNWQHWLVIGEQVWFAA